MGTQGGARLVRVRTILRSASGPPAHLPLLNCEVRSSRCLDYGLNSELGKSYILICGQLSYSHGSNNFAINDYLRRATRARGWRDVYPDGGVIGSRVALLLHFIVDVPLLRANARPHALAQNATLLDLGHQSG